MKKTIKIFISIFLSLVIVCSLFAAPLSAGAAYDVTSPLSAYDITSSLFANITEHESSATSGSYEYTVLKDGTVQIDYYDGTASDINVPSTVEGKKVTSIGEGAFLNNQNVSRVTIPDTVKNIGECAFAMCDKLKTVSLPTSVETIGDGAFAMCGRLIGISVNNANKNFSSSDGVLFNKSKTKIITYPAGKTDKKYIIPSTVKVIAPFAFTTSFTHLFYPDTEHVIPNLTSVTIPNGVTTIGEAAFMCCSEITSITIPNSVTSIGSNAFAVCEKLKSITLSSSLKKLPENIFFDCQALKSIKIPSAVTSISDMAFMGCISLESITIPQKVTSIGAMAFAVCESLSSVTIPNSVKSINEAAFVGCRMKSVTIPKSVTSIKDCAFGYDEMGEPISGFTIKGYKGSAAEKYASQNGFKFSALSMPAPTAIKLNTSSLTLGVGENYTLIRTISPSNASNATSWKSSNTSFADVNKNGKVTAKKAGTVTITAKTSNGKTASCKVTIKPAPASVKINQGNFTLGVGESYTISESTSKGSYARSFSWSSSNTKVATVEKTSGNKAKVVAKGIGTAIVTVKTYNGKTSKIKVTVKPAPKSVKINQGNFTLGVGESYEISQGSNSGSYAKGFTWSSSNPKVASVEKTKANKARVIAKGTGTATIKIKTYNGKTATVKVTVKPAPKSVKIDQGNFTLGVGESYEISQSSNSGSYAKGFTWSSSNSKVASVEKTKANKARVIAKGTGTATIKIKTYNGKTATVKVTVKPAPASVVLNKTKLTLGVNETFIISESTNKGSYAKDFTWSSSNPEVAAVEKTTANKAKILAKGAGTAIIKIKLYNGKTASCTVTVDSNRIYHEAVYKDIYEPVEFYVCNICGAEITENGLSSHDNLHINDAEEISYHTSIKQVWVRKELVTPAGWY